jgi:hypothetical protein
MKIRIEHYQEMKTAIAALPREKVLEHKALELGNDKQKRFLWDLFSAAKLYILASDCLYDYLNDDHIETALKSIAKELNYI